MKLSTKTTKIAAGIGMSMAAFAVLALPVATVSALEDESTTVINGIIGDSITVTSSGPVNISVTPTDQATQSSASDTVTVHTNNAAGYNLGLEMNGATRTLAKGADTIAAHDGTLAVPTALAANSWGFRVDGLGTFGAGPSTALSNVTGNTSTWAGVPANGSPATIKTTSAATSSGGDDTEVWYSMSADTTKPSGTYTNTVLYTAITN